MNKDNSQSFGYLKEIGNGIRVYFIDRRMMTGKLLASNADELFLEVDGMEVTVFKHAIKYIVKDVEK